MLKQDVGNVCFQRDCSRIKLNMIKTQFTMIQFVSDSVIRAAAARRQEMSFQGVLCGCVRQCQGNALYALKLQDETEWWFFAQRMLIMKCCKKYLKVYLLETVQIYLESSFGLDYKKNQHCIVEELKKNTLENSLKMLGFCFKFNLCESLHSGCFYLQMKLRRSSIISSITPSQDVIHLIIKW